MTKAPVILYNEESESVVGKKADILMNGSFKKKSQPKATKLEL